MHQALNIKDTINEVKESDADVIIYMERCTKVGEQWGKKGFMEKIEMCMFVCVWTFHSFHAQAGFCIHFLELPQPDECIFHLADEQTEQVA